MRATASVATGNSGWPRETRPRCGRGRRGDRRSRSERRRDICRSTGPGMAAGRCGRAAAKPREDRESVRDEAGCGRSCDSGQDGDRDLRIRIGRLVMEDSCRVPLRVSRSTVRRRRHRRRRWRMRVSARPSRRGQRERQRALQPGAAGGGREIRGHGRGAQRAPARRRAKPEPSPSPDPSRTKKERTASLAPCRSGDAARDTLPFRRPAS